MVHSDWILYILFLVTKILAKNNRMVKQIKETKKVKSEKVKKVSTKKKISKSGTAINPNFIVLSKRNIKPTQKMLDAVA